MPRRRSAAGREVDFQQDFCFLLKGYIQRNPEYAGVRLEDARVEFKVNGGEADIAVLRPGGRAFLIIETKRKREGREQRDIDPLSPNVIGQAIGYAAQCGAPYFATANKDYIAVFRLPARGEQFRIDRHQVYVTPISALSEEFAVVLLHRVIDFDRASEQERARLATPLDFLFIYRLRSFVDWLTGRVIPAVERKLVADPGFRSRFEKFQKEMGAEVAPVQLGREMAYILMNKIVFYKVLERRYPRLTRLSITEAANADEIVQRLKNAWSHAIEVSTNFEAIFAAGIYDDIAVSETGGDLLDLRDGIQDFITDMEQYKLEELEADIIGHVYEGLIPEEERHQLGQFYTPPPVAEFLTRWAVRNPGDLVLDPAVGSGTFVVKAYQVLRDQKLREGTRLPDLELHRQLLAQLYAVDVNPFPIHLTAMNLAMRDVRHPVTEVNILERDFFQLIPNTPALLPYEIQTTSGRTRRQIRVPQVDAVIANPPYTRWLEIPEASRDAINARLGNTLSQYGLVAAILQGVETAIYQHFVMHAREFLKEGTRLAMIISNSWLQTDVGIRFGQYLLDHFRVLGVLDLGPRIFPVPIVATNLLLLERCGDEGTRQETRSVFAYVDKSVTVDDLMGLMERPEEFADKFAVQVLNQKDIPRNRKWIEVLFGFSELDTRIREGTVPLSELFEPARGTIQYCAERSRGLGGNEFFYLDKERARQRGIPQRHLVPTVPTARYTSYLTFGTDDWKLVMKEGKPAYLFHARSKKADLPAEVRAYIRWGETDCFTRGDEPVLVSQSSSAAERIRKPNTYVGWYDVGKIHEASFFAPYYGRYLRRFTLLDGRYAFDSDFICFRPKVKLTKAQLKALMACLNSPLGQAYVELLGRASGGVVQGLEVDHAAALRVPDVRQLPKPIVESLAEAFDALESRCREIGGAEGRESLEKLESEFSRLHKVVCKAVGLVGPDSRHLLAVWKKLQERRLSRAPEPKYEFVRGSGRMMAPPPRKRRKPKPRIPSRRLDEFE